MVVDIVVVVNGMLVLFLTAMECADALFFME